MRIKDTGLSLSPLTDFHRENRIHAEEPENAVAAAGSFSNTLRRVGKASSAGRTDRIEISGHREETGFSPEELGKGILREISGNADPARLEDLKLRVSSNDYFADPSELARILLTDIGNGKGNSDAG